MKFIAFKDLYLLVVIGLMKVVSWSNSPGFKEAVVQSIVLVAFHCSRKKRRLSGRNLARAFRGTLSDHTRREIVKRAFYEFWRDTFSLLPSRAETTALKQAPLRGIEHLRQALADGRGVILWSSNHFGRMVLAKQILHAYGFPVYKVHAENHLGGFRNNGDPETRVQRRVIRPFFERHEKRFVAGIIHLPGSESLAFTRVFLDRLQRNAIVCAAGDAKYGRRLIPLQFLGFSEVFPTGLVTLANISGASILPMFCFREHNGEAGVVIEKPIRIDPAADRERKVAAGVALYVSMLEGYIRRYPEQYRNWHLLGEVEED
jgi:lauroyl/myristoyl acyltransferase